METDKKTVSFSIRLSLEEYEFLKKMSKVSGITMRRLLIDGWVKRGYENGDLGEKSAQNE